MYTHSSRPTSLVCFKHTQKNTTILHIIFKHFPGPPAYRFSGGYSMPPRPPGSCEAPSPFGHPSYAYAYAPLKMCLNSVFLFIIFWKLIGDWSSLRLYTLCCEKFNHKTTYPKRTSVSHVNKNIYYSSLFYWGLRTTTYSSK